MMVELMMLVVVVASGGVGVGVRDDRVHDPGLGMLLRAPGCVR